MPDKMLHSYGVAQTFNRPADQCVTVYDWGPLFSEPPPPAHRV